MEKETEASIQTAILQYLNLRGIFAWRHNSGMHFSSYKGKDYAIRMGPKGSPDIVGILGNGKFLAIEVKTSIGVVTPEQKEFLAHIESRGGLAFVARSLDDVIAKCG